MIDICICKDLIIVSPNPPEIRCLVCGKVVFFKVIAKDAPVGQGKEADEQPAQLSHLEIRDELIALTELRNSLSAGGFENRERGKTHAQLEANRILLEARLPEFLVCWNVAQKSYSLVPFDS